MVYTWIVASFFIFGGKKKRTCENNEKKACSTNKIYAFNSRRASKLRLSSSILSLMYKPNCTFSHFDNKGW